MKPLIALAAFFLVLGLFIAMDPTPPGSLPAPAARPSSTQENGPPSALTEREKALVAALADSNRDYNSEEGMLCRALTTEKLAYDNCMAAARVQTMLEDKTKYDEPTP